MERRDVGVADERLRVLGDHVVVEQRDDLRRAVTAAQHLHDIDLGIGEEHVEVARTPGRIAGDVVVLFVHAAAELDVVAAGFPPANAAVDLGPVLERRRRRRNADRPAGRKRMSFHGVDPTNNRCASLRAGTSRVENQPMSA